MSAREVQGDPRPAKPRATRPRKTRDLATADAAPPDVAPPDVAPPEAATPETATTEVATSDGATPGTAWPQAAAPEAATHYRSSVYRGGTREAAAEAYHADARVMAHMGYAPESERWSTVLEQVVVVRYVHAPEQTGAVFEALEQAAADPILETLQLDSMNPGALERIRLEYPLLPLEAKISVGAVVGIGVGIVLCLVVAIVSGDSLDAVSLVGFGLLGLLLGSLTGIIAD